MTYNYKEIKGSIIRGDELRIPRAISIYNSIEAIDNCDLLECRRKADSSEVILFTLKRIGVPDEPAFDIHNNEDVAVVCSKADMTMPEVYALRKDFPVALPHSNAKEHEHPVSLCISDVPFADIRHQFSAYDFIGYIRRWFLLNSRNKLHESDRPIEVFFAAKKFCELRDNRKNAYRYLLLTKKTNYTYIVEFVEKAQASHFTINVCMSQLISRNFAAMPRTIGDLANYKDVDEVPLPQSILNRLFSTASRDNNFPLIVSVFVPQKRTNDTTETRIDLFLIKIEQSVFSIIHNKKILSNTHFEEWYRSLAIELIFTLPQPSLYQNRISNRLTKSVKKIACIGTGTLGGNVIDSLVREGFCENIVLVDYDIYFPHNTARHVLPISHTMESKAFALKECLNGIHDQKIDVINGDYLILKDFQKNKIFDDASIVLDASTSVAVERSIALDYNDNNVRKCTIFLNPKGTDLVMLMGDSDGTSRLDLLEMSYLRAILTTPSLSSHLDMSDMISTNDFTCRSESSVINYDDVKILGAVASQQIKNCCANNDAFVGIWHVNEQESIVEKQSIKIQNWVEYEVNSIRIYIACDLVDEIKCARLLKGNCETGGCLIGCYDKDRHIIYVMYQIHEPNGSKCSHCSFIRGCEGLSDSMEDIRKKTGNQVRYLGEWHSHPNFSSAPSTTDQKQFDELSGYLRLEDVPFVQLIAGNDGLYVNARL